LRELNPTVVHFAGHGAQGGLSIHDANGQRQVVAPERDPVPGFEGRWLAGFAPVGDTGFVVIVQTRYDAALKPNTRLLRRLAGRGSAVILVWLAACGAFLWGSVRRRRSLAIGTAPRRPL